MIRAHTTQYAFEENLAMPLQNFELKYALHPALLPSLISPLSSPSSLLPPPSLLPSLLLPLFSLPYLPSNTIGLEFKAVSVHDNFFILKLNSEIGGFRERADLLGYLFKDFFLEFLQLEEARG
jgi:hypothetical protein